MNECKEKEMDALWYNDAYQAQVAAHYGEHYSTSPFYEMWKIVCNSLTPENKILDIGCGTGQTGHMLYDLGIKDYIGFDFSEYAISVAKKLSPMTFYTDDALTSDLLNGNYNTVISCEFIEHLNADLEVLKRIKSGTMCHISTSNSPCENHVRWFINEQEVIERYSFLFKDFVVEKYVYPNNTAWWSWIIRGIKI